MAEIKKQRKVKSWIWIRVKVKSWIRIRAKVKSWIRIRAKVKSWIRIHIAKKDPQHWNPENRRLTLHLPPNHIPGLLLDLLDPGVEIADGLVQSRQALLGGEERVDVVHHVQIGPIQRIAARQHLIQGDREITKKNANLPKFVICNEEVQFDEILQPTKIS